MQRKTKRRLVASVTVLLAAGVIRAVATPAETLASAELAGDQLRNADAVAAVTAVKLDLLGSLDGLISLAVLVTLALIWLPLLRRLPAAAVLVAAGASLAGTRPALAYYDTVNRAEAVTIMPNESAFWIPDTGANRDSQTNLDSEAYLAVNKIALKRFVIPHAIFRDSGGTNWFDRDYYVPTGRMIIVDRAPYNREWVKAVERGTAARDESFPCQTKDGINITAEVSIAASVADENSPKFLHFFGVNNPAGDRTSPSVIFTSVYYGRSLTQVMDRIGRGLVQTAVCREIGSRSFDQANADYNAVMDAVRVQALKFLGDRGITVDYIGWAGTWTFDKDVQQAINDRYTGEKVAPVVGTLQAKAAVDALEGWDRHLPSSLTLLGTLPNLTEALTGVLRPQPVPASR
jgi:hypothetical protein